MMLRVNTRRMPVHVAGERLLPVVDHLHRTARVQREQRRVDLDGEVLAPSECAADSCEVDAHLLLRQREAGRDLLAVHVQPLRRDVDVDATFAVGDSEPGLGPEERLVLRPQLVRPFDDDVAARVGVAVHDSHRAHHVRARIVEVVTDLVRLPVGMKGLRLGGALRIRDRSERLVVDGDALGRAPGLLGMLGGHDRDGLSEVADAVDREDRLVVELEPVRLSSRHVLMRQHRMYAWHRQRGGEIDAADERVRVRGAQRVAPQHPGGLQVARVLELAGRLRRPVGAADALADPAQHRLRRGAHARSAASRTASKIFA